MLERLLALSRSREGYCEFSRLDPRLGQFFVLSGPAQVQFSLDPPFFEFLARSFGPPLHLSPLPFGQSELPRHSSKTKQSLLPIPQATPPPRPSSMPRPAQDNDEPI